MGYGVISGRCRSCRRLRRLGAAVGLAAAWAAGHAPADVCSSVELALSQDVVLEREAFDARMRIVNALPDLAVEHVHVQLDIADADGVPVLLTADPDITNAVFFLTEPSCDGIDAADGTDGIGPDSKATIGWTLIPAPGAGGPDGTLYQVGAELTYWVAGTAYTVALSPQWLQVSPLPELHLDFFLAGEVCGDDPFTPPREPSLPFMLGLRVGNRGAGPANSLRLEVTPPTIVRNEQGLAVRFGIEGCDVDGDAQLDPLNPCVPHLGPGGTSVATWSLRSSLSGTCTNFGASVSHADSLGGQVTALIRDEHVTSHALRHAVIAEGYGRDQRADFLTRDSVLYESSGANTPVFDATGATTAAATGDGWMDVDIGAATGTFFHAAARIESPSPPVALQVTRGDGTTLRSENCWIGGERLPDGSWAYSGHIFDTVPPAAVYTVRWDATTDATNTAPHFTSLPRITVSTNTPVHVTVAATDPDGEVPLLSAARLPAGSRFRDDAPGTGCFEWQPCSGQEGTYRVRLTASDGKAASTGVLQVQVLAEAPTEPTGAIFLLR